MPKILATVLFILGFSTIAQAQSAACANPPISTGTALVGAAVNESFCSTELDTNGNPVTITAFAQYLNSGTGAVRTLQTFTRDPIADSVGRHFYTRALTAPATAGTYIYTV